MARLLVLDNDYSMRSLLALAVERGGHEVVQAGTVDEAEVALDAAAGPVDGMLLDLHLGGGHSGVSVVARWRASQRLTRFLVVTGTPEDPSLAELEGDEFFQGVLAKPFSIEDLLQRVARIVEGAIEVKVQETESAPEPVSTLEPKPFRTVDAEIERKA
ncbi:MAG: response regulator [Planctomycetes bacterium]|nr:response regulator [Planctomycetota bacterium]